MIQPPLKRHQTLHNWINKTRTRLFNLKPVGLNTGEIESLLSYLQRLAEAHCVSMRMLVASTIPKLAIPNSPRLRPFPTFYKCRNLLATDFNRATGRDDLQLLDVSGLFDLQQLYREDRSWCPRCLQENTISYDRLSWWLLPVTTCHIHQCHLQRTCTTCASTQPIHLCNPILSRCILCGSSLTKRIPPHGPNKWELFVANQVFDLLTNRNGRLVPNNDPSTIVEALVSKSPFKKDVVLARSLGFQDNIVALWRSRNKRFKLATLCLFSYCFGPSIAELLWKNPKQWRISYRPLLFEALEAVTPVIRNKPSVIARGVYYALASNSVPSLRQVARRLETSTSTLHRNYPKESSQLILLSKKIRQKKARLKDDALSNKIRSLIIDQLCRGEIPTFEFIRHSLSHPWEMTKAKAAFDRLMYSHSRDKKQL